MAGGQVRAERSFNCPNKQGTRENIIYTFRNPRLEIGSNHAHALLTGRQGKSPPLDSANSRSYSPTAQPEFWATAMNDDADVSMESLGGKGSP